ncbi:MAG: hypothetical protein COB07_03380 [Sulfurovum sp.]|nr:MAG: hypothetical protein COB07_03380 [Sulfurovum sp.]
MKINYSLVKHTEGQILILGLLLLGCFLILILLCALFLPHYLQPLLSLTATNVLFGRGAGLSIGIAAQMDTFVLIALNFMIEAIMVLILYPLFVLSWNKLELVSYPPLNLFLERSRKNADRYKPLMQRYGIIGLILFVLTPFAMTGPVVGSFLGYLIRFSHRVTLFIVLFSTLIAIILWVYLIKNFEEVLIAYSDMLIRGFLIAAMMMFVWYLLKKYFFGNAT